MAAPEVTVLMTVRNGGPYLHDAVESILNQNYGELRFLVLDNASTDGSRQVVGAFDDPRIDLVELPEDVGQTAALNRGLEMIDTPWVARMDADDVSLPRRLELQMAYLRDHPDVVLLGTGVELIDGESRFVRDAVGPILENDLRWQYLLGMGGFAHSSIVFLAAAAARAGGYPAQYRHVQDFVLWGRMFEEGRAARLPERLVRIRRHEANATQPGPAERELRSAMRSPLEALLPEDGADTISGVVDALRYETVEPPGPVVSSRLASLPERFRRAHGVAISRSALHRYAQRWLYMARAASLEHGGSPTAWIKLALVLQPSLLASLSLWRTFASLTLAPVRRRRVQIR